MAAHKGHKKSGGRVKGTPNKKTQTLMEKVAELGVDPFEILLHYASGNWKALGHPKPTQTRYTMTGEPYEIPIITEDMRIQSAKEAAQYIHPKRKAVEVTGEIKEEKAIIVYQTEWGSANETLGDDEENNPET